MKSLAANLKVLVLGSMMLVPAAVLAQQEVSPDIYTDNSPKIERNEKPSVRAKKEADAKKQMNASAKQKDSRKKADDRKLAAANHSKSDAIVIAQAQ